MSGREVDDLMQVLPAGSAGVLVQLDDLAQVLALAAHLRAHPLPGVVDLVPAARTVLLVLDPSAATVREPAVTPATVAAAVLAVAEAVLSARAPTRTVTTTEPAPGTVTVPVVYDGEDLAEIGELTGWGAEGVVARHTATTWTVAFSGFAPGFGYCVADTGPAWRVPRRTTPRTRVPPGSVALADGWTGVYPTSSPGGWQLLGRTSTAVWDLDRDPPALLRPGVRVRFVAAS